MIGWLVVERQRAPSSEPMEFRGLADARPPATLECISPAATKSPEEPPYRSGVDRIVTFYAVACRWCTGGVGDGSGRSRGLPERIAQEATEPAQNRGVTYPDAGSPCHPHRQHNGLLAE